MKLTRVAIGLRNLPWALSLAGVLLLPAHALAQGVPVPMAERPTPVLVLGGTGGAAVGMVALGLAGALIGGNSCGEVGNPDSCHMVEGALWGAAVGYSIGIPVGVHLANGRRGSLPPTLLASAAIAAAGVAIGLGSGSDQVLGVVAVTVPVVQVVSSVIIERRTVRRGAR